MGEAKAKPKPAGFVTLAQVGAFYGSVKWAWPDWIPSGHVTMVAGPQGTGKSYLLAYLAGVFVERFPLGPMERPLRAPLARYCYATRKRCAALMLNG